MTYAIDRRTLSRLTAVALAGTLVVLSPGIGSYQAMAQMVSGAARSAGSTPVVPVAPISASVSAPALSMPAGVSVLPAAALTLPSVTPSVSAPASAAKALPMAARGVSAQAAVPASAAAALPRAAVQTASRLSNAKAAAAVAAPEGAKAEKTALGVLKSAAKGLARSFSAHFDGSRMFGNGAAGALNGVTDGEGSRPVPEAAVSAVLDTLRSEMQKGEAFTLELEGTLAGMAGVPVEMMGAALAELANRGNIAAMTNGTRVFVDVPAASEGNFAAARSFFHQGVALLNDGHIHAQAQAFNALTDSRDAYAALVKSGNPAAKAELEQAEVMRLNAGVEFLRSYVRQIADRSGTGEDKGTAQRSLDLIKDAYFGVGYVPDPLNKYAASWMRTAFEKYRPQTDDTAPAKNLARAIANLKSVVDEMDEKPGTPKALPAPAPKKAPFPLIAKDDKKYENLNKYGSNLTAKAVEGKLTPMIGRKAELRQMVKTLMR
ncbi:MAG: hypothetical protein HY928_03445, partial [Elusimicrobia bacterium]|nr:hypothetical protein [Elusimicrobiota bacterium]